jgi:hypothetical protein
MEQTKKKTYWVSLDYLLVTPNDENEPENAFDVRIVDLDVNGGIEKKTSITFASRARWEAFKAYVDQALRDGTAG